MNKKALALGVVGILTYSVPTMPVKATSSVQKTSISENNQTRTAGLISRYYIIASTSSSGNLSLSGTTQSNDNLKSIGYTNISIEYSTDNVHWDEEKPLDDMLKAGNTYNLNDYLVSVKGGNYYRVKLTHYAKESGFLGSSQSVENTSNSVWID